jgi:hypothetical protein
MKDLEATRRLIVQISCLLSIIGSSGTILTTYFPVKNRFKSGKKLLFWLCICDVGSSLTYLIQTLLSTSATSYGQRVTCDITALLGIFFPVASFLWTDLIGFYVYCIVMYRLQFHDWFANVTHIKCIHIILWSICCITVVLVASFDSEGKQDYGSQWCWIRDKPDGGVFLWEMIGKHRTCRYP